MVAGLVIGYQAWPPLRAFNSALLKRQRQILCTFIWRPRSSEWSFMLTQNKYMQAECIYNFCCIKKNIFQQIHFQTYHLVLSSPNLFQPKNYFHNGSPHHFMKHPVHCRVIFICDGRLLWLKHHLCNYKVLLICDIRFLLAQHKTMIHKIILTVIFLIVIPGQDACVEINDHLNIPKKIHPRIARTTAPPPPAPTTPTTTPPPPRTSTWPEVK